MRVMIVSNRLPLEVNAQGELVRTTGGLASGLASVHERYESLWIGWSGGNEPSPELEKQGYVSVLLSPEEVKEFYESFSNGILWPLFHYLMDQMPLEMKGWETYQAVNAKYTDAIVAQYREGDVIWVHDYQLCLVPQMVRERIPNARIGFFLHIPFPSSEVFRILPWREQLLKGICGADLIGFHTFSYARHFASSLLRLIGVECHVDRFTQNGREVRLGAFPLGVEDISQGAAASDPDLENEIANLKSKNEGKKILLAVDRLDYTKGVPRRLVAFERMLVNEPGLRDKVVLIQIAVPSRTSVPAYQKFRSQVDEIVGRVNGRFGSATHQPIHYIARGFNQVELLALYRAADVMLVTPLRDGMNLVAKEFVASRIDGDGVLLLSEFAGAASELGESLMVNPYDLPAMAAAYRTAVEMPEEERRVRMAALRERVLKFNNRRWSETFMGLLTRPRPVTKRRMPIPVTAHDLLERLKKPTLKLLLDYDGTLVPLKKMPVLAAPDPEILELLSQLVQRPQVEVHVISGRSQDELQKWLGHLPLSLHAEHGLWTRAPSNPEWVCALPDSLVSGEWKEKVRPLLRQFTNETPGSLIEEKSRSLAWHYRMSEPELAQRSLKELRFQLMEALANQPLEMMMGNRVLEIRTPGANKGAATQLLLKETGRKEDFVAFGDDTTDEDIFKVLPSWALGVRVGPSVTRARYTVKDYQEVRSFLRQLTASSA